MQLKIKKLNASAVITGATEMAGITSFNVSKHIRFVPTFSKAQVDTHFLHFETVVCSLKWPKELWTHKSLDNCY